MISGKPAPIKIWLHAARPKTLPAALAPVFAATALAWHDDAFLLKPAFYCLGFALLAQIAANYINDYLDYKSGTDTADRLGPVRAVAAGWVRPSAMLLVSILTLALAVACGALLIPYGGSQLWWVGAACVVFCLLYSPLSRYGMGDVFVLVFFGIVPVLFTYYVQSGQFSTASFLLGCIIGILSTNILISNNYRDYYTDKATGKNTSIVMFGLAFGERCYLFTGIVACLLNLWFFALLGNAWWGLLAWLFLPLHMQAWKTMRRIAKGRTLNIMLAYSSRNLLLFCLLEIIALVWMK
ncbi:MAG: 1,4-dihydroxy-2-naphthoate octaprenyltransferase [Niabella sp.]